MVNVAYALFIASLLALAALAAQAAGNDSHSSGWNYGGKDSGWNYGGGQGSGKGSGGSGDHKGGSGGTVSTAEPLALLVVGAGFGGAVLLRWRRRK